GAIFCVSPQRGASITVYFKGEKFELGKSWDGDIRTCECFNESLFFVTSSNKIYKATLLEQGDVHVHFVRDVEMEEECVGRMLIS
ncbi:hypothetical protein PFISCL1PPCAC_17032, partial [Pristionchus fissidentatus]